MSDVDPGTASVQDAARLVTGDRGSGTLRPAVPFFTRRKIPDMATVPWAGRFEMSQALDPDGQPFIVRANVALDAVAGHPDYPYRVGVAVLNDRLTPAERESLERAVKGTFERDRENVLALVLSARSFLEYVFYSRSPASARMRCDRVAEAFPAAGLDVYSERDPTWITFRELRG